MSQFQPFALAFCLLALPRWASAQLENEVGIEYVAPVTIVDVAGVDEDPELSMMTVNANLAYPFEFKSTSTALVVGLGYRGTVPIPDANETRVVESFHEIGPKLTLVQRFGESWSLVGQLAPQLATNFKDIDSDHLRFTGLLLVGYRFGPRFSLAAGVLASYFFGDLVPLPGLKVDWRISDSLRLDAFLPAKFRLGWRLAPIIEIGVRGRLVGNRFITESRRIPTVEQLVYTEASVAGFVDINLYKPLWLSVWGGATVFREFELRLDSGDAIGDRELSNAPVMGLSLLLRNPDNAQ